MTPTPKPLPCPFCGSIPDVLPGNAHSLGNCWGKVLCINEACAAKPSVNDDIDINDDRGSRLYQLRAVEIWNTRAAILAPGDVEVEKMVEDYGQAKYLEGLSVGSGFASGYVAPAEDAKQRLLAAYRTPHLTDIPVGDIPEPTEKPAVTTASMDEAVEKVAEAYRDYWMVDGYPKPPIRISDREAARAALTAIGYPAMVGENERYRKALERISRQNAGTPTAWFNEYARNALMDNGGDDAA